jgi:hypothetical protein
MHSRRWGKREEEPHEPQLVFQSREKRPQELTKRQGSRVMRLPPLALASRMPDDWQLEHLSSTPRARRATFCASYSFGVPTVYPVIALQVPLSARRAASKLKCLEAANAFDERLADWSAVGRCRVGASPITSHSSCRLKLCSEPALKEDWEVHPDFQDALRRWNESMSEVDESLDLRRRLLSRAARREQEAAGARARARPRVCDIHGRPNGPQKVCLCARCYEPRRKKS